MCGGGVSPAARATSDATWRIRSADATDEPLSSRALRRFQKEARLLAQIEHPGVALLVVGRDVESRYRLLRNLTIAFTGRG